MWDRWRWYRMFHLRTLIMKVHRSVSTTGSHYCRSKPLTNTHCSCVWSHFVCVDGCCSHSGHLGLDPWVELSSFFENWVLNFIQHETLWFRFNIHTHPNSDRNSRQNSRQLKNSGRILVNTWNILRNILEFQILYWPSSYLIIIQSSLTSMTTYRHHLSYTT